MIKFGEPMRGKWGVAWGGNAAAQRSKWYRLYAAAAANIEICVSGIVLCRLRPQDAIETGATLERCDDCHALHTIEGHRVRAKDRIVELVGRNDGLVLGTETARLDDEDEVICVAVVATTDELLFHLLIRPIALIHPRASAVNGMTNEMVADAAAFADV